MTLVGLSSFATAPNAATAAGAAMLAVGVDVQARLVEEPYLKARRGVPRLRPPNRTLRPTAW
jgi:hypothetical protein